MKKFRVIFLFGLMAPFLLRANPILPPPYFSEIYFEGDEWFIELLLWEDVFYGDGTLDDYRLACSSGTAQFKPGIDTYGLEWILITQDSMLSSLSINRFGDFIEIEQGDDGYWSPLGWPIYFGDIEYSYVNYPFPGQSIVNTLVYYGEYYDYYWVVKDNSPTLGSSFLQATTVGSLAGRVLDQNLDPISGIQIKYCPDNLLSWILDPIYTSHEGYFSNYMYARNYGISLIWNETSLLDTSVTVEPDSTTWCDYILDTVLVHVSSSIQGQELSFGNFPNPFSDNTTFVIQLPEDTHYQEGRIIVYDMTGREVYDRMIGQEITGTATVFHHWDLAGNPAVVSPGEYISCLVLDGIVVAKNKSICIR